MDELLRNGTTSAAAYCSVHRTSVDAYFAAAEKRNMLMIGGKVMMDRNAPDALRDTPQSGYDDTKTLSPSGMAADARITQSARASPSPRHRSRWR